MSSAQGRAHPTEVDCEWQVVRSSSGELLLQLSTYGSDTRQSQPKVSQTVQLDLDTCEELVRIIRANMR
ncbi:hypothetical protein [Nocardioides sp. GY 10127]|uniref:hypothetical protein n=1 Tax=Nocardioides sp. GY 10127 TaxID=2569762 RepID=UPI00145845D1|nr:hypothetical protein [Nocardioides sp. GY 10127]